MKSVVEETKLGKGESRTQSRETEGRADTAASSTAHISSSLKPNKQRKINKDASVLWLKISPSSRMKREFPLYKESQAFFDPKKLIRKNQLIDRGQDDDIDTDDENVVEQKKLCMKDLRKAILDYCNRDNPFEIIRNIRDPETSGVLGTITPSDQSNGSSPGSPAQSRTPSDQVSSSSSDDEDDDSLYETKSDKEAQDHCRKLG